MALLLVFACLMGGLWLQASGRSMNWSNRGAVVNAPGKV